MDPFGQIADAVKPRVKREPRVPDRHYEAQVTEEEIEACVFKMFKRESKDLNNPAAARKIVLSALVKAMRADEAGSGAKTYTTRYAVAWARRQGWTVDAREAYSHLLRRHKDLALATDVRCDTPDGVVEIQAAGKGERKIHRERFDRAGGVAKARRQKVRVLYLVFERGNPEPIETEEWA